MDERPLTLASYNKYIEATKGDISVIYMDNAATTMHKPKTVIDAVVAAMSLWEMPDVVRMRRL